MNWTIYWLVIWFGLGFGVFEAIALIKPQRGDTLSETVWHLFNSTGPLNPTEWPFKRYVLLVFMIWLTFHFVFGIWR